MNDDELGAVLSTLLASVDPVPEAALQAAYAAIGWRDLDSDLARLTSEPVPEVSHLRGGQPRLLMFRSGQAVVELEISAADGMARLLGQLDPPAEADVTIQSAAGSRITRADSHGRFSVTGLRDGWMRVVVAFSGRDGERTATEWFRA